MADKPGKKKPTKIADKAFKHWNNKAKRNTGFEDQAGTKLAIETTSSKPLGLKVDTL